MKRVCIDDREQKRGFRAFQYYRDETDFKPEAHELVYGDFVFSNSETELQVAFEYKTLEDFISSIYDNRVFNQALNQSDEFPYHFVIVVGTDKEKQELIRERKHYTGEYMTNSQFYGAYASLLNITSLVQVPNEKTAFLVMGKIANKCLSLKPVLKRYTKSRGSPALRLLANNVHRIGEKTAVNICNTLGLESIGDVFGLTVDDLVKVEGVGEKTAYSILEQLGHEFS